MMSGLNTTTNYTPVVSTYAAFVDCEENWNELCPVPFIYWIVIYSICCVLILAGNMFVIAAVWRQPTLRTVPNMYIVALSIADLGVGLNVPGHLFTEWILNYDIPDRQWEHLNEAAGFFVCTFSPVFNMWTSTAASWLLVLIAVDRFRAIVFPFLSKTTPTVARINIAVVWIVSALPAVICGIVQKWGIYEDFVPYCIDHIDVGVLNYVISIYGLMAIHYAIPMLAMLVLYSFVVYSLKKQPQISSNDRGKVRAVRMLISVVVMYAILMLPPFIIYAYENMYPYKYLAEYLSALLVWMNSFINPVIYGYYNKNFRNEFLAIFKVIFACCPAWLCARDGGSKATKTRDDNQLVMSGAAVSGSVAAISGTGISNPTCDTNVM